MVGQEVLIAGPLYVGVMTSMGGVAIFGLIGGTAIDRDRSLAARPRPRGHEAAAEGI